MKCLISLLLLCIALVGQASTLPDFPFVTVTGTSQKNVTPDTAQISFRITSYNESSDKANAEFNQVTKDVLSVLQQYKIPETAITAYDIDKRIVRERGKSLSDESILGYEFSRSVEVELANLKNFEAIFNKLLKTNNVANLNSRFDYSKRDDLEAELIAKAADNAKQKAKRMAKGLGVSLNGVFAFNDTGSFDSFFATFGFGNGHSMEKVMRASASMMGDSSIFIPQYIEISKTVNVIYKIK